MNRNDYFLTNVSRSLNIVSIKHDKTPKLVDQIAISTFIVHYFTEINAHSILKPFNNKNIVSLVYD